MTMQRSAPLSSHSPPHRSADMFNVDFPHSLHVSETISGAYADPPAGGHGMMLTVIHVNAAGHGTHAQQQPEGRAQCALVRVPVRGSLPSNTVRLH